ncbi:hypothetical protein B0J13DRAFT_631825 [Dactylonectria estremocensis]|uniref:Uncharacterized protein n=1 Tax=Dactylonectria estremocensis TaxID=1079267 RepID=A0A9P9D2H2_9HYPO|nr:hypothetical protein B0J13DRAFT_631825 [Dactylonectria estremocensis]
MDIERAASFAFESLTLQEKSLAREIVQFQYYDAKRLTGLYRAPVLYMDQVLQHLETGARESKTTPRRISLYCDTLIIAETTPFMGKDTFFCNITARQILFSAAESGPAIQMRMNRNSKLLINSQTLPKSFRVEFVGNQDQKEQKTVSIPEGAFGVSYTSVQIGTGTGVKEDVLPTGPEMELQTENWMSLINDDGTLKGVPFTTDNFPRLLNFEYLMAAAMAYENPKLALSILNWICAATKTVGGSLLGAQAQSLRNSIAADNSGMITSVPSLNIYSCKQILKSRLLAARDFEDSFREYMSEERSASSWAFLAADLLRKSDQALEEYGFLSSLARKRYNEATQAHSYAEDQFKKTQKLVDEASEQFKGDVAAWEKKQKIAAAKEILMGLIAVGVAIAATVATAGAAAPVVVGAAANVASTASKVAQAVARVKEIVAKIQEIYEKLEPIIEKLGELFKAIQAMVAAIEMAQTAVDLPNSLKEGDMKLDALNATAQWEIFDIQVGLLEKQFADLGIPNQDKYLFALRSLVVHGKTYLQSQVNVVVRGDELATVQLRLRQQQASRPAIDAMMARFGENKELVSVLKLAMFDRLLAIRALIYVDFNSYVNAYNYHTLSTDSPVKMSAVKPVVDYLADAARLQSAVSAFGSKTTIQRKSFTLGHEALGIDVAQVATDLIEHGRFEFSVYPTCPIFEGFYRIRVVCARVHLSGIRSTANKALRLALHTTGRFADIAPPREVPTASTTYSFTGDARTIIYETDPARNGQITCDGNSGLAQDYTIQTPFTEWTVELAKGGLTADELKTDGLNEVEVELLCDVCYSDSL